MLNKKRKPRKTNAKYDCTNVRVLLTPRVRKHFLWALNANLVGIKLENVMLIQRKRKRWTLLSIDRNQNNKI